MPPNMDDATIRTESLSTEAPMVDNDNLGTYRPMSGKDFNKLEEERICFLSELIIDLY